MALDWIESSVLEIDQKGRPKFAKWYDPASNYPIIREDIPEFTADGYMKYRYTVDSSVTFVEYPEKMSYREQYESIRDVEPGKEREMYNSLNQRRRRNRTVDEEDIADLINSMNENGAWIEQFTVHDISRTMKPDFESVRKNGSYRYAVKELKGIKTRTYMRNMSLFITYLNNTRLNEL
jgi:hypothetical protein